MARRAAPASHPDTAYRDAGPTSAATRPPRYRTPWRDAASLCLGLDDGETNSTDIGAESLLTRLNVFERAAIIDAVTSTDGGISAAIEILQLPRKTFYHRVKRLGIDLRALRRGIGDGHER